MQVQNRSTNRLSARPAVQPRSSHRRAVSYPVQVNWHAEISFGRLSVEKPAVEIYIYMHQFNRSTIFSKYPASNHRFLRSFSKDPFLCGRIAIKQHTAITIYIGMDFCHHKSRSNCSGIAGVLASWLHVWEELPIRRRFFASTTRRPGWSKTLEVLNNLVRLFRCQIEWDHFKGAAAPCNSCCIFRAAGGTDLHPVRLQLKWEIEMIEMPYSEKYRKTRAWLPNLSSLCSFYFSLSGIGTFGLPGVLRLCARIRTPKRKVDIAPSSAGVSAWPAKHQRNYKSFGFTFH